MVLTSIEKERIGTLRKELGAALRRARAARMVITVSSAARMQFVGPGPTSAEIVEADALGEQAEKTWRALDAEIRRLLLV